MNCFHTPTCKRLNKGLPTIASSGVPLRVDILDRLGLLFRYMVDRHHESLFFGCDVSFPGNAFCPPGNCLFLHFLRRFAGVLRSSGYDLVYAWSRDQAREDIRQRLCGKASSSRPPPPNRLAEHAGDRSAPVDLPRWGCSRTS